MIDAWKISNNGRTVTRDDITVTDTASTVSTDQLKAIGNVTWALHEVYPNPDGGRVMVAVASHDSPWFEGGKGQTRESFISGSTRNGTAHIALNEWNWSVPGNGDGAMPVAATTPPWLYTLVHEYGHASDTDLGGFGEMLEWMSLGAGLSVYGQTGPAEGYAEAFAEWILTQGRTSNPAARGYAEAHHWTSNLPPLTS